MANAKRDAGTTRPSLQRATSSIIYRGIASVFSSAATLVAPLNPSTNNAPPHTTPTQPTTSTQTSTQPQIQHTTTASPPPAPPQRRLPNAPTSILTQTPRRPQSPNTWQPTPARIHHRNDDVRDYCAPGSNGWVTMQEQRVADSQQEVSRIDYSWNGGVIIDFAEKRRLREMRRARIGEWIAGIADVEEEEREDGGEDEERCLGGEGKKEALEEVKVNGRMEEEEEESDMVEREKVNKGKERAVEDSREDLFHDCLETLERTEDNEDGDLIVSSREEENGEEMRKEEWQTCPHRYPEAIRDWERTVKASRAQASNAADMAAKERLSGTRLSYGRGS